MNAIPAEIFAMFKYFRAVSFSHRVMRVMTSAIFAAMMAQPVQAQTLPEVNFKNATLTVAEDAGKSRLSVTMSIAPLDLPTPTTFFTIFFGVTGGTATRGDDYDEFPASSATVLDHDTEGTFSFGVKEDLLVEGDETVIFTLTESDTYTIGATNTLTITITDNDVTPVINFESANSTAEEGSGTAAINIVSDQSAHAPTTLNITRSTDSAAIGDDATFAAGEDYFFPATVETSGGTHSATLNLNDDAETEAAETITLTIAAGDGYSVGSPATHTLTIPANDNSDSTLSDLAVADVNDNDLLPSVFAATTTEYDLGKLAGGVAQLDITAVVGDTASPAGISVAASAGIVIPAVTSGEEFTADISGAAADGSEHSITITVTAQNTSTTDYVIKFVLPSNDATIAAISVTLATAADFPVGGVSGEIALAKSGDDFSGFVPMHLDGGADFAFYRMTLTTADAAAKSVAAAAVNFTKNGAVFNSENFAIAAVNPVLTVTAESDATADSNVALTIIGAPPLAENPAVTHAMITAEWTQLSQTEFDYQVRWRENSATTWGIAAAADGKTSHVISGLAAETEYAIQVRAVLSSGGGFTGPWSSPQILNTPETPIIPDAPILEAGDGGIGVSWTQPVGTISGYRIRWAASGTTDYLNSGGANGESISGEETLQFAISGLANGTEYEVAVAAEPGDFSPPTAATPLFPAPDSPTFTAGDGEIVANWSRPVSTGSVSGDYFVRWRIAGSGDSGWTESAAISATTHTISSLTNGTEYEAQVRAEHGRFSAIATATPLFPPPPNLALTVGDTQLNAAWNAPATSGLSGNYFVRWRIAGAGDWMESAAISATNFAISGLANGSEYEAQVRAEHGEFSAMVSETPLFPPPTDLVLTVGDTRLSAIWTAPANLSSAISEYRIRWRTTDTGGGVGAWANQNAADGETTSAADSHAITGLANGVEYEVQVRAANGEYSAAAEASPGAAVATLENIALTQSDADKTPIPLVEVFAAETLEYTAIVDATVTEVIVSAARTDSNASVILTTAAGSGGLSGTAHALVAGENVFTFAVTAQDGVTMQTYSVTITRNSPPAAPDAPTLSAAAATLANVPINVSWSAPADIGSSAITGYLIRWGRGSDQAAPSWENENGAAGLMLTGGANQNSFMLTEGLNPSTSYGVAIAAVNSNGPGAWSPTSFVITQTATDDSRITALSMVSVGSSGGGIPIVLTQTGGVVGFDVAVAEYSGDVPFGADGVRITPTFPGAAKVELYIDDTTGSAEQSITQGESSFENIAVAADATVLIILVATAGDTFTTTTYQFTLTGGASEPTAATNAPTVETSAAVDAPGKLAVSWTWDGMIRGAALSGFILQYRKAGTQDDFTEQDVAGGGVTSATIAGLDAGAGYEVQYAAVNSRGRSEPSPPATARASGAPDMPTISLAGGPGMITVTVTPPTFTGGNAIAAFHIRWRVADAGGGSPGAWLSANEESEAGENIGAQTSYIIANLQGGRNYNVQARAVNGFSGSSGMSEWTAAETTNATRATLTITATDSAKTYGEDDPAFAYTAEGFVGGDDASEVFGAGIPFTRAQINTAAGETPGDYLYAALPTAELPFANAAVTGRYSVTLTAGNKLTIAAKEITYTSTAADKDYDGEVDAPADLGGSFAAGDLVKRAVNTIAIDDTAAGQVTLIGGTFTDKTADDNKTVSGFSLGGDAAGNYTLNTNSSVSGDIAPRILNVAVVVEPRIYDATAAAAEGIADLSGVIGDDDVGVDQSAAMFADANVGMNKVITGYAKTGADDANYAVAFAATGVIAKRPLTITSGGSGDNVPSGDALGDHSLLTPNSGANVGLAGTQSLADVLMGALELGDRVGGTANRGGVFALMRGSIALNAGLGANYELTFNEGNFARTNPGVATVRVVPDAAAKVYGENDPAEFAYTLTLESGTFQTGHSADMPGLFFTAVPFMRTAGETAAGDYGYRLSDPLPLVSGIDAEVAGTPDDYTFIIDTAARFMITRKEVTWTSAVAHKTYDGNDSAAEDLGGGFAGGDVVSGNINGVDIADTGNVGVSGGNYDDANAGDAKSISGFALDGDAAGNYLLAAASSVTGNITPLALTIADDITISREYNAEAGVGDATVNGGEISGAVGGQGFSLRLISGSDAAFPDGADVTTAAVLNDLDTADFELIGDDAASLPANYSFDLSTHTITADITQKQLTVAEITAAKEYDATDIATLSHLSGGGISGAIGAQTFTLTIGVAGGAANGNFAAADAAAELEVTGFDFALTGADEDSDPENYSLPDIAISGEITPLALTAPGGLIVRKVYDNTNAMVDTTGATPVVLADISGDLTGAIGTQSFTLTLAPISGGTFDDVNAAQSVGVGGIETTDLELQGASSDSLPGNYTLASGINITGRIDPRPVSIAQTTVTKVYDGSTETDGVTAVTLGEVSGVLTGSGVTLTLALETDTGGGMFAQSDVGDGIAISGGDAVLKVENSIGAEDTNYDVDPNASLIGNITRKILEIDAGTLSFTKSYDGTAGTGDSYAEGGIGGVVAGENIVVNLKNAVWDAANVGENISVSNVTFELRSGDGISKPSNYALPNLSATTAGSGKIIPATLTLALHGGAEVTKVYDGALSPPPGLSFTSGGVVAGEIVNFTIGEYDSKNVAEARMVSVALAGADSQNYAMDGVTFAASITPATLTYTFSPDPITKVYDGDAANPGGLEAQLLAESSGVIFGEESRVSFAFGEYNSKDAAAANAIAISAVVTDAAGDKGDESENYAPAPPAVPATITTRALRITADDARALAPPAVEDLTYRVAGGIDGEGLVAPDTAADALTGALAYGESDADGNAPINQGDLRGIDGGNYHIPADGFTAGVFTQDASKYDVDASATADATDGILIIRYLSGFREGFLIDGLPLPAATAATITTAIEAGINDNTGDIFDVDADGTSNTRDGIMITRYILGVTSGPELIAGMTAPENESTVRNNIAAQLPPSAQ